jgi:hypothetical protein
VPSTRVTEIRHIMGMPIGIDVPDGDGIDIEPAFAWLREVDAISDYRVLSTPGFARYRA